MMITRKILIVVAIFGLFLLQYSLKSQVKKELTYSQLASQGVNELKKGNYANAERLFYKALEKNPNGSDSHYNLGCTYSLWSGILEGDAKKVMIKKAFNALRQSIAAGFRDLRNIKNDKDLININEMQEYKQIVKDLEYIIAGGMTFDSAKPLPYKIKYPKENPDIPIPLFIFLMPDKSVCKGEINLENFINSKQFAFLLILNSESSKTQTDIPWDDFSHLRIRKTLKVFKSKKDNEFEIDFARVTIGGIAQSGFTVLRTLTEYPEDFRKAVLINTSMFVKTKQYKKFREIKKKSLFEFLVYHSTSDSLAYDKSVKNWSELKKLGFNVMLKTGNFGVNPLTNFEKWKNVISEFIIKTPIKDDKKNDKENDEEKKEDNEKEKEDKEKDNEN